MVRAMRRLLVLLVPLLGCATATPRFSQELATAFAQDEMRRLETPELELYYPAAHREAAERVARRAAECLRSFRAKRESARPAERALLFLTTANFNNAYVTGLAQGEPLHSVNPLQTSLELLHWYGLSGADAADVSCHEMLHVAHFEQIEGLWGFVNAITGPVVTPHLFTERWFTEGLAQFYEGRTGRVVGRPHSPLYRGVFESFVASRGGALGPGDLNSGQRELAPFSGAYLSSLPFVEWLAAEHGEAALWSMMHRQGVSPIPPIGVSLRFEAAFGAPLGVLIEQWSAHLAKTLTQRERPASQTLLRGHLGQLARIAVHAPTGTIALVHAGNDDVPMLRILERDGTERVSQRLTRLFFGRQWVQVGPVTMSGLSFSADGSTLYLMNEDLISRGDTRTQLWRIDAKTADVTQVWQSIGRGQGGTVDGAGYVFVSFVPGRSVLARFDFATEKTTLLHDPGPGIALASPSISTDGAIVFSQLDGNGWNLRLRATDGSVRPLTTDGAFNYGAKWVDADRLTFVRSVDGRLQGHRLQPSTGVVERLTDAPFALMDLWPSGDEVVFINRDGTQWSIDRSSAPGSPVELDGGVAEPPAFAESPPLQNTSDEPYSGFDHLFVPQLRVPAVVVLPTLTTTGALRWNTTVYASLAGKDRLGRHNWAINGSFAWPAQVWSASVGYVNQQLAPWQLGLLASRDGVSDGAFWSAALTAGRSFFTVPVSFGVRALVSETITSPLAPAFTERYLGPEASISYSASESTSYGGPQRQLAVSATARAYPAVFGSDRNVFDLRGALTVAIPLPFSRRQSLVTSVVGRWLPGSPTGALRLGGQATGISLFQSLPDIAIPAGPGGFLPGSLAEGVRGYDDFTVRAEGAGIGSARYRYSFIIDRGTATILWLLPSFFARQIDVEVFGAAALTNRGSWMRAAGGATTFRFTIMDALPVSITYQYAWRFDFGRGGLHTVSLSLE